MKPSLDPILTTHVDLSRSQLQSPFALVQFLESGFNGIPSMMSLRGWSPDCSNRKSCSSTSSRREERCLDSRFRQQQMGDLLPTILGSPIELALLNSQSEAKENIPLRLDDNILVMQEDPVHLPVDDKSEPAPEPVSQLGHSAFPVASAPPSPSSAFVSTLWVYLPALLVISALLFDLPATSRGFNLGHLGSSPVMLSFTLCGMLLFWLLGCLAIVLTCLVIYEIVSMPGGDTCNRKFSRWERITLL